MEKVLYCKNCGNLVASTCRVMPGSIGLELFLWLCFLLPGLIYSVWRHSASYWGCPSCRGRELIAAESPVAQQALAARGNLPAPEPVGAPQAHLPIAFKILGLVIIGFFVILLSRIVTRLLE